MNSANVFACSFAACLASLSALSDQVQSVECVVYSHEKSDRGLHVATIVTNATGRVRQWDFPASYTGHRSVCRLVGATTNDDFCAWIGGQSYVPGYPFGVSTGRNVVQIDLTRTCAMVDRINLYTGKSSRSSEVGGPLAKLDREWIRLIPVEVRGSIQDAECSTNWIALSSVSSGWRVAADFFVDKKNHPTMTEFDILSGGDLDLNWSNFSSELDTAAIRNAVGKLTGVRYAIAFEDPNAIASKHVVSNTWDKFPSRVFNRYTERYFEPFIGREGKTSSVAVFPIGTSVDQLRPTFKWRHEMPESVTKGFGNVYTAFYLRILTEARWDAQIVYNSGMRRVPAADENGIYAFQVEQLQLQPGDYYWEVEMFNAAKQKPEFKASTGFIPFSVR